jgi:hypothetical protein
MPDTFMKPIVFIILLVAVTNCAFASSTEFSPTCRKAYHDIICLQFNDAHKKIESEKKLNPGNSIHYLLENYIDFLIVMISEEKDDFDKLKENREFRLQRLMKGNPASPWYLYSQSEIYLQSAFARIKFGEYISAGIDINRAYRLLEDNNRKFPDFIPDKIRLGLLHTLVGTVPGKYQWAVKALDFEGSIPQGLDEIKNAYKSCQGISKYDFLLPETIFLMSFVSSNLSGDKKELSILLGEFAKPLVSQLAIESPLVCYALVNLKLKTGKNDEAIKALSACERTPGKYPFYFLDYLLGVAKLNRLDKDAYLPLMKYVADFRGMNYIKSAYEHLAWYYLISGDMEKCRMYKERIKLRGSKTVDNDKQALNNAEHNETPDISLLKARLFFDGGYYEKSMNELSNFASGSGMTNSRLKLEYTYRTARVYDETGDTGKAIYWYEETIQAGTTETSYYAANASLHLGLIYESLKKNEQASLYFQKCLDLDFEQYNFSITQKAKSGLNRIKNR